MITFVRTSNLIHRFSLYYVLGDYVLHLKLWEIHNLLCFCTLSIVLFLFKTHGVSETAFGLRVQVKPTQLVPIDRASPYHRTNWVDSTWKRRENPVSEALCVLNKNRTMYSVQKHKLLYLRNIFKMLKLPVIMEVLRYIINCLCFVSVHYHATGHIIILVAKMAKEVNIAQLCPKHILDCVISR
jgi:hypothetical protein